MEFHWKNMEMWRLISLILLIIGGLNWGFVGLCNLNIIFSIFGHFISRVIFIIVGVAAVFIIYDYIMNHKKAI